MWEIDWAEFGLWRNAFSIIDSFYLLSNHVSLNSYDKIQVNGDHFFLHFSWFFSPVSLTLSFTCAVSLIRLKLSLLKLFLEEILIYISWVEVWIPPTISSQINLLINSDYLNSYWIFKTVLLLHKVIPVIKKEHVSFMMTLIKISKLL